MLTARKIVVYLIVPMVVELALIGAYFSFIPWLQQIVSPYSPRIHIDSAREFGLLENLQNACLIAMMVAFFKGARKKP